MWVFHKPLSGSGLSPWMRWTTDHTFNFQITCMWSMLDPISHIEHVFMGDSSGHIYRLEGTGDDGDGDTTDVTAVRTSKLVSAPGRAQMYDLQGVLKFRPVTGAPTTNLTLTVRFQGEEASDSSISVPMEGADGGAVFGGDYYFNDGSVFGSAFEGRLIRENFAVPGQGNDIQCQLTASGKSRFEINEVYCGFKASG